MFSAEPHTRGQLLTVLSRGSIGLMGTLAPHPRSFCFHKRWTELLPFHCNNYIIGLLNIHFNKLQLVQNVSTRSVSNTPYFAMIDSGLYQLQLWRKENARKRATTVAAPALWNRLPFVFREESNFLWFNKAVIKTFSTTWLMVHGLWHMLLYTLLTKCNLFPLLYNLISFNSQFHFKLFFFSFLVVKYIRSYLYEFLHERDNDFYLFQEETMVGIFPSSLRC